MSKQHRRRSSAVTVRRADGSTEVRHAGTFGRGRRTPTSKQLRLLEALSRELGVAHRPPATRQGAADRIDALLARKRADQG